MNNRILIEYNAVKIEMVSENAGERIKIGDEIKYKIYVTNIGKINYNSLGIDYITVKLYDYLPLYFKPNEIKYNNFKINLEDNSYIEENDESNNLTSNVELDLQIPYQKTIIVEIIGEAEEVSKDTTIENKAIIAENVFKWMEGEDFIIYNPTFETKNSNVVSHTICTNNSVRPNTPDEPDNPEEPDNPDEPETPDKPDNPETPDTPDVPEIKKYKLNGFVWNDKNGDGEKQNNEQLLSEIQTYLLNSNGQIVKETKTDNNGNYEYADIESADYTIVFKYNTNQYRITKFKANGVSENLNSNATKQDVVINGEKISAGVTEQIALNKNVENINLGLIENKKFDFKVENYISKITVKTKNGTTETPYSKVNLAKAEIRAKEIEGAVVTVEYKIVVTNNGDLPGKVGKVIDYLPDGLNIATDSIALWTKNTDGSLINTSLENQTIEAGKSVELTLLATRTMTENSTGTLTNKVNIDDLSNELEIEEINIQNNSSKSELILSISTGMLVIMGILVIIVVIIFVVLNMKYNIFKYVKFKVLSLIVLLSTIVLCNANISSNAENDYEGKVYYKTFALWNNTRIFWYKDDNGTNYREAGRWRNNYHYGDDYFISDSYLETERDVYLFNSSNAIRTIVGNFVLIDWHNNKAYIESNADGITVLTDINQNCDNYADKDRRYDIYLNMGRLNKDVQINRIGL